MHGQQLHYIHNNNQKFTAISSLSGELSNFFVQVHKGLTTLF